MTMGRKRAKTVNDVNRLLIHNEQENIILDGYDFSMAEDKNKRAKDRKKKLATRNKYERQYEHIHVTKPGKTIQPYETYTDEDLKYIKSLKDIVEQKGNNMPRRIRNAIIIILIVIKAFFLLACGCSNAELRSNGDGTYSCPVGVIFWR